MELARLNLRKPDVTVAYMGGVPAIPEPFVWSLMRMLTHTAEASELTVEPLRSRVSYHSLARNTLAWQFKGEWLLQLDTDHDFEPDLLLRMLNTATSKNIKVLSGLYRSKAPPYAPVAYLWGEKDGVANPLAAWETDVFQVDATGGGCLLIHRSVFERIGQELQENPFDIRHPWGEDFSFFRRLKDLGIPAFLDTRVEYKHLRWKTVEAEDTQFENCVMGKEQLRAVA